MVNFVCSIFVVATITAFVVTLMHKWGLVEYMQVRGKSIVPELAKCNFCLSWWVALVLSVALSFALEEMNVVEGIVCAVCATPISRFLL